MDGVRVAANLKHGVQSARPELPILKYKLCILSNCSWVTVKCPVTLSNVAPVACWYAWKASVAIKSSVEPVSTTPAVGFNIVVLSPYVIDCSMPQYLFAGEAPVIGTYSMFPVNLELSTSPNVSSPLTIPD